MARVRASVGGEPDATLEDGLRRILGRSTRTLGAVPDFLRVGMQVLLEKGEQHAGTRAAFLDIRAQVRRMITAWMVALLGSDVPVDVAEDLAVLVVAFTDGLLVGSQVYADWDPDEYVDLFVGMFREVVERERSGARPHALGARRAHRRLEQHGVVGDSAQLDRCDLAGGEVRAARRPWRPRRAAPTTARAAASAAAARHGDESVGLPHPGCPVPSWGRTQRQTADTLVPHVAGVRRRVAVTGGARHRGHRHPDPVRWRRPGPGRRRGRRPPRRRRRPRRPTRPARSIAGDARCARRLISRGSSRSGGGSRSVPGRSTRASGTLSSRSRASRTARRPTACSWDTSARCASNARRSSTVSAPITYAASSSDEGVDIVAHAVTPISCIASLSARNA